MTEAERIGKMFAQDLLNYQKLGGNMNNLTANNVYNVLNGKSEVDDLSEIETIFGGFESLTNEEKDEKLNTLHKDIKEQLKVNIYNILFRILRTDKQNFDSLTRKQKYRFIREGYKHIITSRNTIN